MKQAKAILYILIMFFGLSVFFCSCANTESHNDEGFSVEDNIHEKYSVKEIKSEIIDFDSVKEYKYSSEINRFTAIKYNSSVNNNDSLTTLISFDRDFRSYEEINLNLETNDRIVKWDTDESGNIAAVIKSTVIVEEDEDSDEAFRESSLKMLYYNYSTEEYNEIHAEELNTGNLMVQKIFAISTGKILLCMYDCETGANSFHIYDRNSSIISIFNFEEADWIYDIKNISSDITVLFSKNEKKYICEYNIDKNITEGIMEVPFDDECLTLVSNHVDNNIYMLSSSSLSKKNDDGSFEKICNLISLGYEGTNISCMEYISIDEFIFIENDLLSGNRYLYELSDKDDTKNSEREEITLAVGWLDNYTKSEISRFNRTNQKYRISIVDYSIYENEETDMNGSKQLEIDFLKNNAPDVILYTSFENGRILERMGAFTNLYGLIDSDNEISRNDFNSSVLSAYEKNGCLYSLPVSYKINTLAGLAEVLGDTDKWNCKQMMQFYLKISDNIKFMNTNDRASILNIVFYNMLADYIDYEDYGCQINTEDLLHFLEFVKKFGREESSEDLSSVTSGKAMLADVTISSFENFHQLLAGHFDNKDVVFVGYPSNTDGSMVVSSDFQFSINEKSAKKSEAWDFIREFYIYNYQIDIEDGFPVNNKAFDDKAKSACNNQLDEAGNIVPNIFDYYSNDKDIGYFNIDEYEILKYIVSQSFKTYIYDYSVYQICEEELEPFIFDDQTAEETLNRIQRRISIYMNEIK